MGIFDFLKSESEQNNEKYAEGERDAKEGGIFSDLAHDVGGIIASTIPQHERTRELADIYDKGYQHGKENR